MPRRNHRPERTCLGCGGREAKASMVRIAAREGRVVPDPEGKAGGRGGYLHGVDECMEKFTATKVRKFRSLNVRMDRQERQSLSQEIRWLLDRAAKVE